MRKSKKIKKNTKNQKNTTTPPYTIYEYQDDTVRIYQYDQMFPPRNAHETIDVIDIGLQPEDTLGMPDLIDQDDCSVSTSGDNSVQSSTNSTDDLPDLIPQRCEDDSNAEYDSEPEIDFDDDEVEMDIKVEYACIAKVMFVDDNNNYISLDVDAENAFESDELLVEESRPINYNQAVHDTTITNDQQIDHDTADNDLSTIPLRASSSNDSDSVKETATTVAIASTADLDSKSASRPNLLKPTSVPVTPIDNERILEWLGKQHPSLADSFAMDFKITNNKPSNRQLKAAPTPSRMSSSHVAVDQTINVDMIAALSNVRQKKYQCFTSKID